MSEPSATRKGAATARELSQHVGELRDDVDELAGSLGETLGEARQVIADEVRASPYASLALGAGVGFVLAGGLTVQVGGALFRLGTRVAFKQLVRRVTEAARG